MNKPSQHESNRKAWNQGAKWYEAKIDETIEFLKSGKSSIHPVEKANIGDFSRFQGAIHLQCASGMDTLSLLNEGAKEVIGIDISDNQIENATKTAKALNANARFVRSDILEVPHEFDGTADLVYTGQGAICWIWDLNAWGKVIARLLKKGGVFHVLDMHPALSFIDIDAQDFKCSGLSYFNYELEEKNWGENYIGDLGLPEDKKESKFERAWTMADVFNVLTDAGLQVTKFGEHIEDFYNGLPNMKQEIKDLLPKTFSMMAVKP
ncbi:MAG: class I SAM-dependent methyltransferase [Caldisericia bacterium]|nr:class I SAM-dependent methyltransferase [Caldisericia bacterium]